MRIPPQKEATHPLQSTPAKALHIPRILYISAYICASGHRCFYIFRNEGKTMDISKSSAICYVM
jgi:hypothetical protein